MNLSDLLNLDLATVVKAGVVVVTTVASAVAGYQVYRRVKAKRLVILDERKAGG